MLHKMKNKILIKQRHLINNFWRIYQKRFFISYAQSNNRMVSFKFQNRKVKKKINKFSIFI